MTKSKVNFLLPLSCLFLCILYPSVCSQGVRQGLSVSLNAALPAIFPSLILSNLLVRQASAEGEKAFSIPFLLGLFCGFPVGAGAVASLVREGKLSLKDGERLLFFCNNASPAFLISYCGKAVLKDVGKGVFLFLLQSALSLLCFLFFFGKRLFQRSNSAEKRKSQSPSLWKSIPSALRESAFSFLYIMSCVIFFSFLTELLGHLFSLNKLSFAVTGIFSELCGGLAALKHFSPKLSFFLCAVGCGWGGLSVQLQSAGLLEETGLSVKSLVFGRLFFATVLGVLALFFQNLL